MTLIDPVLLKSRLGSLAGRFDVDALAECDSTNSELMRRADRGAPSGTVIVADRQSAGRGRRGRSWLSSPEGSLTFSLLWRFTGNAARLSGLSLAVGVGLARALAKLGAEGVRLKWPNDVLLVQAGDFAKLAGILGELSQPASGLSAAGVQADRHDILSTILVELAGALDCFSAEGFAGLRDAWQGFHAWQGQPVHILGDEQALAGLCLGVDVDGALLLDSATGIARIFSGDVSLRRGGA